MAFLPELVGSFSTGASENPTAPVMEAAFAHERLDWRYVNCEVEPAGLAAAVAGARAMGWRGFNCSIPHKQSVIALVDELSETARICQAVNCVANIGAGWIGHNTDGAGFVESLRDVVDPVGGDVLVIGSGGAASAIAVEVARAGARSVRIASRNHATASSLARLVEAETSANATVADWQLPLRIASSTSVAVNATPVGMSPDDHAMIELDWDSVPSDLVVADVVVNPPVTRFLATAAAAGAPTLDGRGMLVAQAAENIRLWTGVAPARSVMRAALDDALASL